jgi:predicted secreted protein
MFQPTALGESLKAAVITQNKAMTNSFKVTLTSLESSVLKSVAAIDKKIASNKALQSVAVSQTKTKKEIESLKLQTKRNSKTTRDSAKSGYISLGKLPSD